MFNRTWNVDELRPIVEVVLDTFGPERVMLGSNFPVDKLYRSYDALWDAYDEMLDSLLSADQQHQVRVVTAERFYRI